MSQIGAYAFLFDADHESLGCNYGRPLINQIVLSIFKSEMSHTVNSCMQNGDISLHGLSSKISEIVKSPSKRSSQSTYTFDKEMYLTLAVRFAEETSQQWSTIDTETFREGLLKRNTFCITFPTLDKGIAIEVNELMKANPAYYGVLELDLGNPVQCRNCLGALPILCYIKNGRV